MSRFKTLLLDIDGTLVDSNDLHAQAWVDACFEHGLSVPFEKIRPLIGMGGDLLLKALMGLEPESDKSEEIRSTRASVFKQRYLPSVRPFPCAREFVVKCSDAGLCCVAASSSSEKDAAELLRIAGVDDLVHDVVTGSDAARTKPCPDIIEAAVAKSGKPAAEAVLIGDTPYDIEAASRAGVVTIAVRSGGWPDERLRGAIDLYDDVASLSRGWRSSPLG